MGQVGAAVVAANLRESKDEVDFKATNMEINGMYIESCKLEKPLVRKCLISRPTKSEYDTATLGMGGCHTENRTADKRRGNTNTAG